jgi:hypothetical protein
MNLKHERVLRFTIFDRRFPQSGQQINTTHWNQLDDTRDSNSGPDEAQGVYPDDPQRAYLARLAKDHGECAGYNP